MNTAVNQRSFDRKNCEIPVLYAINNSKSYYKAMMYNFSKDGLYLETTSSLEVGAEIWIEMFQDKHHLYDIDTQKKYFAKIKWCNVVDRDSHLCFGAGIKFVSEMDVIRKMSSSDYSCDKCGKKLTFSQVNKIEKCICLCFACYSPVMKLPKAKKERSLNAL